MILVQSFIVIWLIGWGFETFSVLYNIKRWYAELIPQSEKNYSWVYEMYIGSFLEATARLTVIIFIKSFWPIRVWKFIMNRSYSL